MKLLIAAVLSILILTTPVIAEELKSPGILPDNPIYPIKIFFEKIKIKLTFNPEAKAKLYASLAEQRLAELNATIEKGKLQYVERLRKDYENKINETGKILNRTEGLGRNATVLAEHVCNMTYKHVAVLERVLEKVPEQAKPAIEHVINVSIERHENCAERVLAKWNKTIEEVRRVNCTADTECRNLICPLLVGYDTPICDDGKCRCGAKWEIINKTEWKERFREEWTNATQKRIERIKEKVSALVSCEKLCKLEGYKKGECKPYGVPPVPGVEVPKVCEMFGMVDVGLDKCPLEATCCCSKVNKTEEEKTCDQKCKDLDYKSGICRSWTISPEGFKEAGCKSGETGIGYTSDCTIFRDGIQLVGVGKTCCCQ